MKHPREKQVKADTLVWMRFGFLLLVSTCVFAQSPLAIVTGLAKDPSGSPIANAAVTLIGDQTGVEREAKTNDTGAYSFSNLLPGTYHVEAKAAGFRDLKTDTISAAAYRTIRQDLAFEIATASAGVTVSARLPSWIWMPT